MGDSQPSKANQTPKPDKNPISRMQEWVRKTFGVRKNSKQVLRTNGNPANPPTKSPLTAQNPNPSSSQNPQAPKPFPPNSQQNPSTNSAPNFPPSNANSRPSYTVPKDNKAAVEMDLERLHRIAQEARRKQNEERIATQAQNLIQTPAQNLQPRAQTSTPTQNTSQKPVSTALPIPPLSPEGIKKVKNTIEKSVGTFNQKQIEQKVQQTQASLQENQQNQEKPTEEKKEIPVPGAVNPVLSTGTDQRLADLTAIPAANRPISPTTIPENVVSTSKKDPAGVVTPQTAQTAQTVFPNSANLNQTPAQTVQPTFTQNPQQNQAFKPLPVPPRVIRNLAEVADKIKSSKDKLVNSNNNQPQDIVKITDLANQTGKKEQPIPVGQTSRPAAAAPGQKIPQSSQSQPTQAQAVQTSQSTSQAPKNPQVQTNQQTGPKPAVQTTSQTPGVVSPNVVNTTNNANNVVNNIVPGPKAVVKAAATEAVLSEVGETQETKKISKTEEIEDVLRKEVPELNSEEIKDLAREITLPAYWTNLGRSEVTFSPEVSHQGNLELLQFPQALGLPEVLDEIYILNFDNKEDRTKKSPIYQYKPQFPFSPYVGSVWQKLLQKLKNEPDFQTLNRCLKYTQLDWRESDSGAHARALIQTLEEIFNDKENLQRLNYLLFLSYLNDLKKLKVATELKFSKKLVYLDNFRQVLRKVFDPEHYSLPLTTDVLPWIKNQESLAVRFEELIKAEFQKLWQEFQNLDENADRNTEIKSLERRWQEYKDQVVTSFVNQVLNKTAVLWGLSSGDLYLRDDIALKDKNILYLDFPRSNKLEIERTGLELMLAQDLHEYLDNWAKIVAGKIQKNQPFEHGAVAAEMLHLTKEEDKEEIESTSKKEEEQKKEEEKPKSRGLTPAELALRGIGTAAAVGAGAAVAEKLAPKVGQNAEQIPSPSAATTGTQATQAQPFNQNQTQIPTQTGIPTIDDVNKRVANTRANLPVGAGVMAGAAVAGNAANNIVNSNFTRKNSGGGGGNGGGGRGLNGPNSPVSPGGAVATVAGTSLGSQVAGSTVTGATTSAQTQTSAIAATGGFTSLSGTPGSNNLVGGARADTLTATTATTAIPTVNSIETKSLLQRPLGLGVRNQIVTAGAVLGLAGAMAQENGQPVKENLRSALVSLLPQTTPEALEKNYSIVQAGLQNYPEQIPQLVQNYQNPQAFDGGQTGQISEISPTQGQINLSPNSQAFPQNFSPNSDQVSELNSTPGSFSPQSNQKDGQAYPSQGQIDPNSGQNGNFNLGQSNFNQAQNPHLVNNIVDSNLTGTGKNFQGTIDPNSQAAQINGFVDENKEKDGLRDQIAGQNPQDEEIANELIGDAPDKEIENIEKQQGELSEKLNEETIKAAKAESKRETDRIIQSSDETLAKLKDLPEGLTPEEEKNIESATKRKLDEEDTNPDYRSRGFIVDPTGTRFNPYTNMTIDQLPEAWRPVAATPENNAQTEPALINIPAGEGQVVGEDEIQPGEAGEDLQKEEEEEQGGPGVAPSVGKIKENQDPNQVAEGEKKLDPNQVNSSQDPESSVKPIQKLDRNLTKDTEGEKLRSNADESANSNRKPGIKEKLGGVMDKANEAKRSLTDLPGQLRDKTKDEIGNFIKREVATKVLPFLAPLVTIIVVLILILFVIFGTLFSIRKAYCDKDFVWIGFWRIALVGQSDQIAEYLGCKLDDNCNTSQTANVNSGATGTNTTGVCLEVQLQGKSDNDTISLWAGNAGILSQIPVKVGIIKQVLAAGKQAGVSAETTAFALSVLPTEASVPDPWKIRGGASNDFLGIAQIGGVERSDWAGRISGGQYAGAYKGDDYFINNPGYQLAIIDVGFKEKISFGCAPGNNPDVYEGAYAWLTCDGVDGFGTTSQAYAEAAQRNYNIATCAGGNDLKPVAFNPLEIFGPVTANAATITAAKMSELETLEQSGKITYDQGAGYGSGQARSGDLQPVTVDMMIKLGNSYESIRISSLKRDRGENSSHDHGYGIDITGVTINGKNHEPFAVYHEGATDQIPELVKFATGLAESGAIYFLVTHEKLASELLKNPIFQRVQGEAEAYAGLPGGKVGLMIDDFGHDDHYHISLKENASVNSVIAGGGGSNNLPGGAGSDTLGGANCVCNGTNKLVGGSGNDTLSGGAASGVASTADQWTALVLAILESPSLQGRLDVLVVIANRVGNNFGGYGATVIDQAFASGQFEPFFSGISKGEIQDKQSAITALTKKGYSEKDAAQALDELLAAIGDPSKVADSQNSIKSFVYFKGVTQYAFKRDTDFLRSHGENFFHDEDSDPVKYKPFSIASLFPSSTQPPSNVATNSQNNSQTNQNQDKSFLPHPTEFFAKLWNGMEVQAAAQSRVIQYKGKDGVTVQGTLFLPDGFDAATYKDNIVILGHDGFTGDGSGTNYYNKNVAVGERIASQGSAVFVMDYESGAGSRGGPQVFSHDVDDTLAAMDMLQQELKLQANGFTLAGSSRGAGVSALAANRDGRVTKLAVAYPVAELSKWTTDNAVYSVAKSKTGGDLTKLDLANNPPANKSIQILVSLGDQDSVLLAGNSTAVQSVQNYAESLKAKGYNVQFEKVPGGDHGYVTVNSGLSAAEQTAQTNFLAFAAGKGATSPSDVMIGGEGSDSLRGGDNCVCRETNNLSGGQVQAPKNTATNSQGSGNSQNNSQNNSQPTQGGSDQLEGFLSDPTEFFAKLWNGMEVQAAFGTKPNSYSELSEGHKKFLAEIAKERGYSAYPDGGGVNPQMKAKFEEMKKAAAAKGLTIDPVGFQQSTFGYRSYDDQIETYFSGINSVWSENLTESEKQTVKAEYLKRAEVSAPPGFSEHHTGLALDINSLEVSFDQTPEFKWLQANAGTYGFKLSYPEGVTGKGAGYEPWHWHWDDGTNLLAKLANKNGITSGGSDTISGAEGSDTLKGGNSGSGSGSGANCVPGGSNGGTSPSGVVAGQGDLKLLETLRSKVEGLPPKGLCYQSVYFAGLMVTGFGKLTPAQIQQEIDQDVARSGRDHNYARHFADFLNEKGSDGQTNAKRLGIVNLLDSNPNMSPYNAPAGAIVVVTAGSPGTSHTEAGDITVADGKGGFYNDGDMKYGGPNSWKGSQGIPGGSVLGIYLPPT